MQPLACLAFRDYFSCYDSNESTSTIEWGISIVNPQDRFSKKLARQIAIGRMVESPCIIKANFYDKAPNISNLITEIMSNLSVNKEMPKRITRRASKILKSLHKLQNDCNQTISSY